MALNEEDAPRVVFVKSRKEGGISFLYDPDKNSFGYQVFVQKSLPLITELSNFFESFEKARSFAADLFAKEWEMLAWTQDINRPCMDGGHECGSGSCETCKSTGGGCTTCGALD